ncbi:hypothetical protein B0H14DRAFT_3135938 [Mycena olivaceomarginata]|nr:hypothetical protein B0H14DRAFT_3135938 [Mycena olivaceomarginata]
MTNLFTEKHEVESWGVLMGRVAELGGIQDRRQWGEGGEMGGKCRVRLNQLLLNPPYCTAVGLKTFNVGKCFFLMWWLPLVLVASVAAAQNNHTIDDASPLVQKKFWDGCPLSSNCSDPAFWNLDSSRLYDHTFTPFSDVEFNFTGTALYIFIAVQPQGSGGRATLSFALDDSGWMLGSMFTTVLQASAQYNISAYHNTSIPLTKTLECEWNKEDFGKRSSEPLGFRISRTKRTVSRSNEATTPPKNSS